MNEIKEKQEDLASVEKNKENADEVLKEKKKLAGKQSRELAELEQKIRVVVSKISQLRVRTNKNHFLSMSWFCRNPK